MNILIFNQDWFADEFRKAGHNVITCGTREHLDLRLTGPFLDLQSIIDQLGTFVPDRIVVLDESSPIYFTGFEDTPIPTLFYSVDTHHHADIHRHLANTFDATLVAQKDFKPLFDEVGAETRWFPLWASRYVEACDQPVRDVVFVGNLDAKLNPERIHFFRELEKRVPITITMGAYWELFPQSRIVINQTVKGDLNFRVFEAMMCGAALLTEASGNGLTDIFEPGKHLVTYEKNNIDDAVRKIEELLGDPERCKAIGKAGRDEILRNHTKEARAATMLEILNGLQKKPVRFQCFSAVVNQIWLLRAIEKVDASLAAQTAVTITRLIEKGIARGEQLTEELAFHSVVGCIEIDRLTRSNHGEQLLVRLQSLYPELLGPKLARIWIILNRGERENAEVLARELGATEDINSTFHEVDQLMSRMLSF